MDNSNNEYKFDPNTGKPLTKKDNQVAKKSKKSFFIILAVIIVFAIIFIVAVYWLVSMIFSNSNKLICESDEGDITILYSDSSITGYVANGITYDLDEQTEVAKQIGIDNYILQFQIWFETNTTGTCKIKEK